MKTTLFKEVGYSLSKLIADIDAGEIGLPDIQRPFVWTPPKVRDLFDSMYRGFPVGYLLFWAVPQGGDMRQIGTEIKQKVPHLVIVDGQQRLTSLYAVLRGREVVREGLEPHKIVIAFRPRDGQFEVRDAAIVKDPEFIPDISRLWSGVISQRSFINEFIDRLGASRALADDEKDQLAEAIADLHALQAYPFTALELSASVDEQQVADVFVRINSKGITLNQADFILTLMSVFWDAGRSQLEKFCADARRPATGGASPFNHFVQPHPDRLLRAVVGRAFKRARLEHVYSLLRGKDLETGEFSDERREEQFMRLQEAQRECLNLTNWHEFLKTLLYAGYAGSSMITSELAVLYSYTLFLLGRLEYNVRHDDLRRVIARWFFMAAITGRYTNSPESAMEADLARLRTTRTGADFVETLDGIVNDRLSNDYWRIQLPNDLATTAARSPTLFGYYAALRLLDARVLFSELHVRDLLDPSLQPGKAALDRHHLFPKAYLRRQGYEERDINQIANYALVEWADNIDISDKPPSLYLPAYLERMASGDAEAMYRWHALPPEWEEMTYPDFLIERRRLMADVVRDAFETLAPRGVVSP